MIAFLEGIVADVDGEKCTIDVQGVGYSVFSSRVNLKELGEKRGGARVKLFTRLIHRDDSMELYGFLSRQELALFCLLITVSGIGPRNALKILGSCDVADIARAVVSENSGFLMSIAGIGEKKAQQIVLALKEKIRRLFQESTVPVSSGYLEAIALLESLGFTRNESKSAVDGALSVMGKEKNVEKIVELALRNLSSGATGT